MLVFFHFETSLGCYLSAKRRRKMIKFLRRMPVCALIFQFSLFTFYPTYLGHFNSKMEIFDAHLDANQRWRTRVALRARSRRHARIPRLPKALKPGNESQLNLQNCFLIGYFSVVEKKSYFTCGENFM